MKTNNQNTIKEIGMLKQYEFILEIKMNKKI